MLGANPLPLHLTFFVTARCPLRCKTCFYWQHTDTEHPELTLAEITRLAPTLQGTVWLAVTGGEPFTRPDLPDVMGALAEEARPLYLTLVTNGLYPEKMEEVVRSVFAPRRTPFVRVSVSLDGVGSLHDEIRGRSGSFDRAVETIEVLRDLCRRYPRLSSLVVTCYNAHNQDTLEEIPAFLRAKFPNIDWDFVLARGDSREASSKSGLDLQRYFDLKRKYCPGPRPGAPTRIPERIIAAKNRAMIELQEEILRQRQSRVACRAGSISAVVDEQGQVTTCEMRQLPMGSLREHSMDMRRFWRSPEAIATRAAARDHHPPCGHECNLATNMAFSAPAAASILRGAFRFRDPA